MRCADVPGWENKAGENCYAASCSNELPLSHRSLRLLAAPRFQGFSSNTACCKCGGGQEAATKPRGEASKPSKRPGSPTMWGPWLWAVRQWDTPYLARRSDMLWTRLNELHMAHKGYVSLLDDLDLL